MIERKNNLNLQYNNTAHSSKSNSTKSSKLSVFRSAVSNVQNTSGMKFLLIGIIALLIFSLAAAPVSAAWDGTTLNWSWYDSTTGPYYIYDEGSLAALSEKVGYNTSEKDSFSGKTINLMNNLDLGNQEWTPIGKSFNDFTGTFNGNNHTISNLYIYSSSNEQGLFGSINGATIKNLVLTDVNVKGKSNVGGLVGYYYEGTIENCFVSGNVTATGTQVGGLAGYNYGGTIQNCFAAVNVTGNSIDGRVGGLVGHLKLGSGGGNIANSYAVGNVTGKNFVGGLIGENYGGIYKSVALNQFVNAPGATSVGRVVGSGSCVECYAWEGMKVNNILVNSGGINGTDASSSEVWANLNSIKIPLIGEIPSSPKTAIRYGTLQILTTAQVIRFRI